MEAFYSGQTGKDSSEKAHPNSGSPATEKFCKQSADQRVSADSEEALFEQDNTAQGNNHKTESSNQHNVHDVGEKQVD